MKEVLIPALFSVALSGCADLGIGADAVSYEGDFGGLLEWTRTGDPTCSATYVVGGSVRIELGRSEGDLTGAGTVEVDQTPGPSSPPGCPAAPTRKWTGGGVLSGTPTALRFSHPFAAAGSVPETIDVRFLGTLGLDGIRGTLFIEHSGSDPTGRTTSGSAAIPVALR